MRKPHPAAQRRKASGFGNPGGALRSSDDFSVWQRPDTTAAFAPNAVNELVFAFCMQTGDRELDKQGTQHGEELVDRLEGRTVLR